MEDAFYNIAADKTMPNAQAPKASLFGRIKSLLAAFKSSRSKKQTRSSRDVDMAEDQPKKRFAFWRPKESEGARWHRKMLFEAMERLRETRAAEQNKAFELPAASSAPQVDEESTPRLSEVTVDGTPSTSDDSDKIKIAAEEPALKKGKSNKKEKKVKTNKKTNKFMSWIKGKKRSTITTDPDIEFVFGK